MPIESPTALGVPVRESANATAAAPTPTFPGVTAKVPATSTAASVVIATPRGCATPNDAQAAESPTKRDRERQSSDREGDDCRRGKRQKGRAEPDRNDRTDAHKPRRADRRSCCRDTRGACRLPVESEPSATTDPCRRDGVDERADPVAGDRISAGQLAALRCEPGAPRAAATRERPREAQRRDREECRIRCPRMREPFVDGRKQMAQHDLPRVFGSAAGFPCRRLETTPTRHRIATVSRRRSREVGSSG